DLERPGRGAGALDPALRDGGRAVDRGAGRAALPRRRGGAHAGRRSMRDGPGDRAPLGGRPPAPRARRIAPLLTAAGAVLLTARAAPRALAVGGHDPGRVASALIGGACGSPEILLSVTLVRSVPLILTGLAVVLAFRAGVWNIGAEGQLYAGAIAGTTVGLHAGGLPPLLLVPAVLVAAALGGLGWALVPALMRLRLGVGEVITTILMNFVALNLAAYMVRGPLQEGRGVF